MRPLVDVRDRFLGVPPIGEAVDVHAAGGGVIGLRGKFANLSLLVCDAPHTERRRNIGTRTSGRGILDDSGFAFQNCAPEFAVAVRTVAGVGPSTKSPE